MNSQMWNLRVLARSLLVVALLFVAYSIVVPSAEASHCPNWNHSPAEAGQPCSNAPNSSPPSACPGGTVWNGTSCVPTTGPVVANPGNAPSNSVSNPGLVGDPGGLVSCSGRDCGTCQLIVTGNRVVQFIILIMVAIAVVIVTIAGFRLAMSGGSQAEYQSAKSLLQNLLVGIIVILVGWLIVDTVLKALLHNSGQVNINGQWMPWNQVACTTQSALRDGSVIYPGNSYWVNVPFAPESSTSNSNVAAGTGGVSQNAQGIVAYAQQMMAAGCVYNQSLRNGCQGNPAYTDCSDLVNAAYQAAGCSSPGTYTGNQINSSVPINNSTSYNPGDALIYRSNGQGHVVICVDVGCNQVIHAAGTGRNIVYGNGSYYKNRSGAQVIPASNFCP